MNKVVLVGRLTRDPEATTTSGGVSLAKFTLAVNRNYANANGEREVDFINIIAWRSLADNCGKYLKKGSQVGISGSMQTRSYEDKNGDKRYVTEVIAEEAEFLSSRENGGAEPKETPKNSAPKRVTMTAVPDEDLPF